MQQFYVDPENPLRDVEYFLRAVNEGKLDLTGNVGSDLYDFRFTADLNTKYREELKQLLRGEPVGGYYLPALPADSVYFVLGTFRCGKNMEIHCRSLEDLVAKLQQIKMRAEECGEECELISLVSFFEEALRAQEHAALHFDVGRTVLLVALSGDLCQCKTCGDFFLEQRKKTGRPRRDYCSDDHRDKFHALKASARATKSREDRRRRQALLPRRLSVRASEDARPKH